MGGSEESVYYISQELAKKGYRIIIYSEVNDIDDGVELIYNINDDYCIQNDCSVNYHYQNPHHSHDHDHNQYHHRDRFGKVKWLHHTKYNLSDTCDVFISWRYSISMGLGSHCRLVDVIMTYSISFCYYLYIIIYYRIHISSYI